MQFMEQSIPALEILFIKSGILFGTKRIARSLCYPDCWPHVQSTLNQEWGSEEYTWDWEDRQAVGWSPEVADGCRGI